MMKSVVYKKEKSIFILITLSFCIPVLFIVLLSSFAQIDLLDSGIHSINGLSNDFTTYKNSKFNLSIDYPKGWEVIENNLPFLNDVDNQYQFASICPTSQFPEGNVIYNNLLKFAPELNVTDPKHDVLRCAHTPFKIILGISNFKTLIDLNNGNEEDTFNRFIDSYSNTIKNDVSQNVKGDIQVTSTALPQKLSKKIFYTTQDSYEPKTTSVIEILTLKNNYMYSIKYFADNDESINSKSNLTSNESLVKKSLDSFVIK